MIETRTLLGGQVRVAVVGAASGSLRLDHPGGPQRVAAAAAAFGVARVGMVAAEFTRRVATADDLVPLDGPIWRTRAEADGLRWRDPTLAFGLSSADCATAVLARDGEVVALHLGLRGVWRDGDGPSLLETVIAGLDEPASWSAWVGAAAGPCCHGFPERTAAERAFVERLRRAWGAVGQPHAVRHGPRRGFAGCDHRAIAVALLERAGVGALEVDTACTACAGLLDPDRPGFGDYFSHTRDVEGTRQRNLVLVAPAG
ncbi:MAG: laccase domain-containing protein [Myxococcales bacterium]|nr:laccase domain-containing protein [Myxococcales bacterium]